jgi:branched-subunit amino acid ABC-type transport system permease component
VESYAGKVRVLGVLWIVYAALTLIVGFAGLAFAKAFLSHGFGPWMHGPMPQDWFGPAWIHLAWIFLSVRAVLCAVAGWGLLERTQWGRIVAIIAAILCLIRIPLGTALGIATLVILLGCRNSTLYEQL